MNWDTAAAIAEVVGATAVVISLLYLAFEVRSNTKVQKANSSKDAQLQWAVINEAIWQSPERMIIARALDPNSTSDDFSLEEKQIVFWFSRAMLQRFESELFQYQAGLLNEELWDAHRTWCAGFLQLPVIQDWWEHEQRQPAYTRTFIKNIEAVEPSTLTPELLGSLAKAR